jgi:hypothetical protein
MRKFVFILSLFVCFSNTLLTQPFQNVMIDNTGAPEEPSICINPKNINLVVAAANIDFFYWSSNGGLSWTKGTLTGTYGFGVIHACQWILQAAFTFFI